MRSNTSFFLEILESLCLDILDGIFLDWICPFVWAYEALAKSSGAGGIRTTDACTGAEP
jgi:hypothetical protein